MVVPLPFDVHLSSAAEKIEKNLTNNPNPNTSFITPT